MRKKRGILIWGIVLALAVFTFFMARRQIAAGEGFVNPHVPYTYEQLLIDCAELAREYPDIVAVSEIGESAEGRKILAVRLGRGDRDVLLVGSHHAREYITSAYLMETIDEYARAYTKSGRYGAYDLRRILDSVTLHIVVMLNPDGVALVQQGLDAAEDPEAIAAMAMAFPDLAAWKANLRGVNLNMNYPAEWELKTSVDGPSSENFKGYAPASEPETRALMAYTLEYDFLFAASMHSKGEVVYWADARTVNEFDGQRALAEVIRDATGYTLMPISANPGEYAGGYENWFRAELHRPAFCVELTPTSGDALPHDDADFDALVWTPARYLVAALGDAAAG
ncbi:MAG: hypothetical protein LBT36_05265 [Oscillospiraceae bacterium]|jgi:g-D-glutamyl-meso-diaminopimelate peptidase|nr:hypothetical protein [Oscillospiraceae bacterium]